MNSDNSKRIVLIGWALHALGCAVVLLLAGAFYVFAYQRFDVQKSEDTNRSQQLSVLLASSSQVQRDQMPLRKELDELQESVALIRSRLPAQLEEQEFINQVNASAKKAGIEVINHRTSPSQLGDSISSAQIHYACEGSFASICKFIEDVRQIARITEISKFDVESEKKSGGYPFEVTFVLYYGAPPNDRDKGEIP